MRLPKIIISYRRQDTATAAGRIRDRLASYYGADSVFMDIDTIPYGVNFRDYIAEALAHTDLLLAIIGPRWAGSGRNKRSRLHDAADILRIELEKAFELGIPVIPVLVEAAAMPEAHQLPESLHDLLLRNAATIDSGRDFHPHMDRLIRSMDRVFETKTTNRDSPRTSLRSLSSQQTAKPTDIGYAINRKIFALLSGRGPRLISMIAGMLGVIFVSLAVWFLPVRSPAITGPTRGARSPDPVSCGEEKNLRSQGTKEPTEVYFINHRSREIRIYWINHNGDRTLYGILQKGQFINIQTYITHPWVVTDKSDNCIAIYMPTSKRQEITIAE